MAKATLDRIVEEIKTLAPDERRQLREMLETMLAPAGEEDKRQALHQALRAAGLVTQVRQPRATDTPYRRRIEVQGKPGRSERTPLDGARRDLWGRSKYRSFYVTPGKS